MIALMIVGGLLVTVVLTILFVRSGARIRSAEFYRLASVVLAALLAVVVHALER